MDKLFDKKELGFRRVGAAIPKIKVADCEYNSDSIISLIDKACESGIELVVFPELSITGYTCADLFFQTLLRKKAIESLIKIRDHVLRKAKTSVIVGLPMVIANHLYNVAAVISSKAGIVGFVPKKSIPNYGEFYEKRWFASSSDLSVDSIMIDQQQIPIGNDLIFSDNDFSFAVEICEDLWTANPPSSTLSLHGAKAIFNLSAGNELVGKNDYRRSLISQQSARCIAAYIYAGAGWGESTTDLVFAGNAFIAEDGRILQESKRFLMEEQLIYRDIDIKLIENERIKNTSFVSNPASPPVRRVDCPLFKNSDVQLKRDISRHPFVPESEKSDERFEEIFNIQVSGLMKRLQHINCKSAVLGISGGLDSTLALLVTHEAFKRLNLDVKGIFGITMPCFGTTKRTYDNAKKLMELLDISILDIDISKAVFQHFKDIGQDPSNHDITYENSQARERTQILMDYANKANGIVIGSSNLSELALGWATYNGDHMSMYAVNSSLPKTLVRSLTQWIADKILNESQRAVVNDIILTPYSPELIPVKNGVDSRQETEEKIGPYELHDFFLYHFLRNSFSPKKIFFLAVEAFKEEHDEKFILKYLHEFFKRFFSQQFKRSCLPDGPKIGSVNLSPRGDWRMPSDASSSLWLKEIDDLRTRISE